MPRRIKDDRSFRFSTTASQFDRHLRGRVIVLQVRGGGISVRKLPHRRRRKKRPSVLARAQIAPTRGASANSRARRLCRSSATTCRSYCRRARLRAGLRGSLPSLSFVLMRVSRSLTIAFSSSARTAREMTRLSPRPGNRPIISRCARPCSSSVSRTNCRRCAGSSQSTMSAKISTARSLDCPSPRARLLRNRRWICASWRWGASAPTENPSVRPVA